MEPEVRLPLDLYALGRGVAYAAALVLVGACAFAALVPRWRHPGDDDRSLAARATGMTWRIARGAALGLLAAHLLRAWGQARSFFEPDPVSGEGLRLILLDTSWGHGWLAQVTAALLACVAAWYAPRRPALGLGLLGTAALAVAAVSSLTGHAAEHPWGRALGTGLHAVHVIGGGVWLGALFTMGVAALRVAGGADAGDVARMVRAFSPVALGGAAVAILAGSLLTLAYVASPANLVGTRYGQVLLAKLLLLAGAMAVGARNWRRLTPRLGSAAATRELSRSAAMELAIGASLIGATALLVSLPAPGL